MTYKAILIYWYTAVLLTVMVSFLLEVYLFFSFHTEKERVRLVKRSWESVGTYCSSLGRQSYRFTFTHTNKHTRRCGFCRDLCWRSYNRFDVIVLTVLEAPFFVRKIKLKGKLRCLINNFGLKKIVSFPFLEEKENLEKNDETEEILESRKEKTNNELYFKEIRYKKTCL